MVDAPLRIDWLDDRLDATSGGHPLTGRLGMTVLPGKHGPSSRYPGRVYRRELAADLATLASQGVRRLILLVEDAELRRWGDSDLVAKAATAGVDVVRHPMPDGGTPPSLGEMDVILREARTGRAAGNVAVACMGGVGRTGMVAACALVATGLAPADAIARVRRIRHPEAVETPAQEHFVAAYAEHVAAARPG
jgi:protein-tyrosine phosphatase